MASETFSECLTFTHTSHNCNSVHTPCTPYRLPRVLAYESTCSHSSTWYRLKVHRQTLKAFFVSYQSTNHFVSDPSHRANTLLPLWFKTFSTRKTYPVFVLKIVLTRKSKTICDNAINRQHRTEDWYTPKTEEQLSGDSCAFGYSGSVSEIELRKYYVTQ